MKRIVLLLAIFLSLPAFAIDWTQVEKDLNGEGAVGWVHGAVDELGLFVFTVRNPENFFDFGLMSLVTTDEKTKAFLETASRHDKIRVKGKFMDNPSPFHHVEVASLEMVKEYDSGHPTDPYEYNAKIPEDLLNRESARFLVHAIAEGGKILVVEYKDTTMPIFVRTPELTKDLYRGDAIELAFTIQRHPDHPTHIRVNARADTPIKVIESVKALHLTKADKVSGKLIMFPKSPEIIFNVFALYQQTEDGLNRQFTLVNFDDAEKFKAIRQALQDAWDKHPGEYVNGRNKLVSKNISVRVSGVYNVVDAGQANPQILLDSVDSIEILDGDQVIKPFGNLAQEGIILPKNPVTHDDETMHPGVTGKEPAVPSKFQCEADYKKAASFFKFFGKYLKTPESTLMAGIGAAAGAGSCIDTDAWEVTCTSGSQAWKYAGVGAAVGYVGGGVLYAGISKSDINKASKAIQQILSGKDGKESLELMRDVRQAAPVVNEQIATVVKTMDAERAECSGGKVLDYNKLVQAIKTKLQPK